MSVHAMVDLETLSTANDAMILQVSAVTFDPKALATGTPEVVGGSFNMFPDLESQHGRRVDGAFFWWLRQEPEASYIQQDADRYDLKGTLIAFADWYKRVGVNAIWSHGANFDIGILLNAFVQHGVKVPWGYRDMRDTRTLFEAAELVRVVRGQARTKIPDFAGVEHDALADARHQVLMVQAAYADLLGTEKTGE